MKYKTNILKLCIALSFFSFSNSITAQDNFNDEPLGDSEQILSVSGAVIDASSGNPIAGANIVVDDTDLGAAADEDGKFSIEGVQNVSNIVFTNKFGLNSGYSQFKYNFEAATRKGIIYPPVDPSIFELKYPNSDIIGRITR